MYFVASYVKVVQSQVGNAIGVEARAVLADRGPPLEADMLLKCVGFEVNEENEATTGRSHIKAGWVLDAGCFAIWEVRPDGGGVPWFNSYCDQVIFQCKLLRRYWTSSTVLDSLLQESRAAVRLTTLTSSEVGAGFVRCLMVESERFQLMLRDHVDEVLTNSMATWTPEQFIGHNEVRWGMLHDGLRSVSTLSDVMAYLFADILDVVRSEAPRLFRVEAATPTVSRPSPSQPNAQQAAVPVQGASSLPESELVRTMVAMPVDERQGRLEGMVLEIVKDLSSEDESLTVETPLMDAGVDSLAATELVSQLSELSSLDLAPTLMFEFPSPRLLALHLLGELGLSELHTPKGAGGSSNM